LAACPSSASPWTQLSYNCTRGLAANSRALVRRSPRSGLGRPPVLARWARTQLSYNCTRGLLGQLSSPCPALSPGWAWPPTRPRPLGSDPTELQLHTRPFGQPSEPFPGALPGARLAACPSSASPRTQLSYNCTRGLAAKPLEPFSGALPGASIRCRYGRPHARPRLRLGPN